MSSIVIRIGNYLNLVRFGHTIFAMPFAMIGFFLAVVMGGYDFSTRILVLVVLCMVFARNAAMAFNRLIDSGFDLLNPRTSKREIPAGIISKRAATAFVIINSVFFVVTTAYINKLTFILSPLALSVVLGYSFFKRFSSLCHFVLGLGLGLAPIGAYISVSGKFDLVPVIYSFIVLTWVGGFDIIYSLQDDEFDKMNRLHSIPSLLGIKGAMVISSLVHVVTSILVVLVGFLIDGGPFLIIGTVVFMAILFFQHVIIKKDDLGRINIAFGTLNGIASLLYSLFVIIDLYR